MGGLGLDGDFFESSDPPAKKEIVPTSAMNQLKQRIQLDYEGRSKGVIRLVFGRRGYGKSTSLAFVRDWIAVDYPTRGCLHFDAGRITDQMSSDSTGGATIFKAELARQISRGKMTDIYEVLDMLAKRPGEKDFLLIDNLDRLYTKSKGQLDLVKRLFDDCDAALKRLRVHYVIVITAAPEWMSVLRTDDLSYLNVENAVTLASMTHEELEQAIQARLEARGKKVDQLFSKGFLGALLTASGGSPRRIFQRLEKFNEPEKPSPPLQVEHYLAHDREAVLTGIRDSLQELAAHGDATSPRSHARGHELLQRFFAIVGAGPKDQAIAISELEKAASTGIKDSDVHFKHGWGLIAEPAPGRHNLQLRKEVRELFSSARVKCGIPVHYILQAIAEDKKPESATATTDHDRQWRAAGLSQAALGAYNGAFDAYHQLAEVGERGTLANAEIIERAWVCVAGVMLAARELSGLGQDVVDLQEAMRNSKDFKAASNKLLDGMNTIFSQSGIGLNLHSEDLRHIATYRNTLLSLPEKARIYEPHQMDELRAKARRCFEGILESLTVEHLEQVRVRHLGEVQSLIARREGPKLEFKASFRWNLNRQVTDTNLEDRTLEAVCALANAEGGTILLGVYEKTGEIVGILPEIKNSDGANEDAFERLFRSRLQARIPGSQTRVKMRIVQAEREPVAIVEVSPPKGTALELISASEPRQKRLLVRDGNTNRHLAGDAKARWLAENKMQV